MMHKLFLNAGLLAMFFSSQPRITQRGLGDIAVISVPASAKTENGGQGWPDETGRLTYGFSSTYLWASMGSVTRYKQLVVVSVMAPDATDAEYAKVPRRMNISYQQRKPVQSGPLGTGTLTVSEGVYELGNDSEPALQFLYYDRAKRLAISWHAVKKEVDLATGIAQLGRIAASFRIVRDPVSEFASMRAAPIKEAQTRASQLQRVQAMLKREGYALTPGKPELRNGVYFEWMDEPEPRYQLLVPLGRVRAAANGSIVNRPRPKFRENDPARPRMAGGLGWREIEDDEWRFYNNDNDILPMRGIGAELAAQQQDRGFVYFYYVATVRVEEENSESVFTSLRWFLDGVPEVQRLWREGALVAPGKPDVHDQ